MFVVVFGLPTIYNLQKLSSKSRLEKLRYKIALSFQVTMFLLSVICFHYIEIHS